MLSWNHLTRFKISEAKLRPDGKTIIIVLLLLFFAKHNITVLFQDLNSNRRAVT